MTTTYDIKFRQRSTAKKTNIGVITADGIRAKIGKNQKKSIIRRLNQGVDPRKFGIKIDVLQRWTGRDLTGQMKVSEVRSVKNTGNKKWVDYKCMKGQERANMVRKIKKDYPNLSQAKIAALFGCGKTTIGDILKNKVFA